MLLLLRIDFFCHNDNLGLLIANQTMCRSAFAFSFSYLDLHHHLHRRISMLLGRSRMDVEDYQREGLLEAAGRASAGSAVAERNVAQRLTLSHGALGRPLGLLGFEAAAVSEVAVSGIVEREVVAFEVSVLEVAAFGVEASEAAALELADCQVADSEVAALDFVAL